MIRAGGLKELADTNPLQEYIGKVNEVVDLCHTRFGEEMRKAGSKTGSLSIEAEADPQQVPPTATAASATTASAAAVGNDNLVSQGKATVPAAALDATDVFLGEHVGDIHSGNPSPAVS